MELKVGDIIYKTHYGKVIARVTIDRVTRTQALSQNIRFRKEYSDPDYIKAIGDSTKFNSSSYSLESEKLKEEYFRSLTIRKINNFDFNKLSTEDLIQFNDTIKTYKDE